MPAALAARLLLWLWFAGVLALGHLRTLERLPALAAPAIVAGSTALLLAGYFRLRPVAAWVDGIPLRTLVLLHATRFVGAYFIHLYQRDELPRALAVSVGIGEIVIATLAVGIALLPIEAAARLRAIVIWNVVGLVDLGLALFTTARVQHAEPGSLAEFLRAPLILVPLLLLPLLLATHAIVFVRALRDSARR